MTGEKPPGEGGGISVLVIADPGVPTRQARRALPELEDQLRRRFSGRVDLWLRTHLVRIRPDDTLDLTQTDRIRAEYEQVDLVLVLTEVPRHVAGRPRVAEAVAGRGVAVISSPTLGVRHSRSRLTGVLLDCVLRITGRQEWDLRTPHQLRRTHWQRSAADGSWALHADALVGGPRTVMGMVKSNDPWRTAPRLSGALAAAAGAGAFGIFYNSIWQMASYLSAARLGLVGILAIVLMVIWLILNNRLWDRATHQSRAAVVLLYNLSTIVTLTLCVTLLYVALVVVILLTGLVIIDPGFMASILKRPVGFRDYLTIAWFSAALGVVAGGLGANFDAETHVRQLTHGQRERQRRYSEEDPAPPAPEGLITPQAHGTRESPR